MLAELGLEIFGIGDSPVVLTPTIFLSEFDPNRHYVNFLEPKGFLWISINPVSFGTPLPGHSRLQLDDYVTSLSCNRARAKRLGGGAR